MSDWVLCPHCGEKIAREALACRHCGSDDNTGWSDSTYMDGLDLPESGEGSIEEYIEGLEREGFANPKPSVKTAWLAVTSLVLAALFALWLLRGLWQ